jgi:hypothetical protein
MGAIPFDALLEGIDFLLKGLDRLFSAPVLAHGVNRQPHQSNQKNKFHSLLDVVAPDCRTVLPRGLAGKMTSYKDC